MHAGARGASGGGGGGAAESAEAVEECEALRAAAGLRARDGLDGLLLQPLQVLGLPERTDSRGLDTHTLARDCETLPASPASW